jgi:hypothetical protein
MQNADDMMCIVFVEVKYNVLLGCRSAYVVMFAERLSKYCEVNFASLEIKSVNLGRTR